MSERKNLVILIGFVLSVSLFTASFTALLLTGYYGRAHVRALEEICQGILENQPEAERAVLSVLKEYKVKGLDLRSSRFSGKRNDIPVYGPVPAQEREHAHSIPDRLSGEGKHR